MSDRPTIIEHPVIKCRAAGGYLIHLRVRGVWKAYCGFAPSSRRARQMIDRSGWHTRLDEPTCRKCIKKRDWLLERMKKQ